MSTSNLPTIAGNEGMYNNRIIRQTTNQNELMNDYKKPKRKVSNKKVTFQGKQIIDVESYKIYNQDDECAERIYRNMQRMALERENSKCCCFIF